MKKIVLKLYEFDELSKDSQERIIEREHWNAIIDYYNAWCTYPEDFSLEDLMRQCYDNFFKSWHEEYEYWADNEDAIREELHHNQYEDRLYYENGDVYVEPLNEIA